MLRKLYLALGSIKLTVVLLLLLALLTFIGTLAQVEHGLFESQRRYFDAWLVLHPVRELRIPLPGGQAVMALLFVNLLIGGFVRMRRTWRLLGIYVVHTGIAILLIAGFVKLYYSDDGYLAIYEGDRADFFESHHLWELAIARAGSSPLEFRVDEAQLQPATSQRLELQHQDLPFDVVIDAYGQNTRPMPASDNIDAGDVVDGYLLRALPPEGEKENDMPGAYVTIKHKAQAGRATPSERRMLLWGSTMLWPRAQPIPEADGGWTIDLRKKRYQLPFQLRLDDFRKEDHPGTAMAAAYESDVTQLRGSSDDRKILIEMNQPLRDAGYIVFQSGWGPQTPGHHERYYSQFAIVRNPSDQWPLIACLVIALGLVIHFCRMLWRHVQRESAQRQEQPA